VPHGDKKRPATRAETDASLRDERAKTDKEVLREGAELVGDVNAVVRKARDRADTVLSTARRCEDEKASGRAADRVRDERSRDDAAIGRERNVTDATLDAERVRRQIAVASLFVAERHETDSRLLIERESADENLIHRDDFLAMLSHDMRSLLGGIALNAAMLERQGQHDLASIARYTASIQRISAQMTRLVADLLDVASFDAGKFVLVRERRDAGSLVRQAADAFEPMASGKNISLSVDVPNEDLIGDFDPGPEPTRLRATKTLRCSSSDAGGTAVGIRPISYLTWARTAEARLHRSSRGRACRPTMVRHPRRVTEAARAPCVPA
jgi:signal transduction histidine kinase